MLAKVLAPKVDLAALILRVGLAGIFIVHGIFKVVGGEDKPLLAEIHLFGNLYLTQTAQAVVGWIELICGVALVLGLLSRIAAVVLIALQVGAIYFFTGKHALMMDLTPRGLDFMRVGPEYNIFLILTCLAVMLLGSGVLSVDHCLAGMFSGKKETAPVAVSAQPPQAARMR